MISTNKEPKEKYKAWLIPSCMEICIAATFSVPNGSEPIKLISIPVKKIRSSLGIIETENTKYEISIQYEQTKPNQLAITSRQVSPYSLSEIDLVLTGKYLVKLFQHPEMASCLA